MKYDLFLKLLILSFLLYACKDMPSQPPSISLSKDDQIRYEVFSNWIEENKTEKIITFIGHDDKDGISGRYNPSEQLLLSLQVHYVNIKKYSQGTWNSRGWVCDKLDSTKTGIFLITSPLFWTSPSEVNLEFTVQRGLRAAHGFRFYLRKNNNTYVIDSLKLTWVS